MTDGTLIEQAVLDYIEGWYAAEGQRMDRAIHAKLAKRRISPEGEVRDTTRDWMVDAAQSGRGRIEYPEKGCKDITILDATDTMASVKLVSEVFVDYIHLAKVQGRWVIVNVLWDFR
ncbi:MAG: nuclear transport factor 2 family protein [Clostridia bacterium]|nr:nuclear transport factor 2 family protein [Clostridia bacterium]